MRVLLSVTEGYMLSEFSRLIYSPGYARPDLQLTEHQALCAICKLVEARLIQEGVDVVSKRYDDQKSAEYTFDKARQAAGFDAAVLIGLNSSQNCTAQFSSCTVHQQQAGGTKDFFEGMMWSFGRFIQHKGVGVPSRYPKAMRRVPYLDSCKRIGVPAVAVLPFFYTDNLITNESLGTLIESSAKAISEGILAFNTDAVSL